MAIFDHYYLYTIIVTLVAIVWLALFRYRWILDRPWHDRIPMRTFKVPNFQGIFLIMWLRIGLIIAIPWLLDIPLIKWLLIIATWYGVFNFINDIIDWRWDMTWIRPIYRLLVQISAVVIYIGISWIHTNITLFWYELHPWLWFVFSIGWIVWCINMINFFDGSHAMTAGVSSIGFSAVAFIVSNVVLTIYTVVWSDLTLMNGIVALCILMSISCFVYTLIEFKPSGVLRDVGMSFIWFLLWALSLLWWAKVGTMLLVFFLPICDSIRVFINRILIMKKNPMKGDYTHLHHRLMRLWFTRSEVRWPVRFFTLTMFLLLIMLGEWSIDKLILFVRLVVLFFVVHIYLYWIKKIPFELLKKEKKQID